MNRESVDSSNVKSVGYDLQTQTLEAEFSSGAVYQYEGVSPELHQSLMDADSIGGFLRTNIIKGAFKTKKL